MRSVSIACFVGLCLSFAAIACVGGDDAEPIPAAAVAPQSASEAQPTGSSANTGSTAVPGTAPSAAPPESPAPTPAEPTPAGDDDDSAPVDADAGAPVDSDAGDGGKPVIKIPKPKLGKLHAEANTGELCIFLVDAKAKGTAKTLDLTLGVGKHTVSCERSNGTLAEEAYEILDGETTNVVLMFKGPLPPAKF